MTERFQLFPAIGRKENGFVQLADSPTASFRRLRPALRRAIAEAKRLGDAVWIKTSDDGVLREVAWASPCGRWSTYGESFSVRPFSRPPRRLTYEVSLPYPYAFVGRRHRLGDLETDEFPDGCRQDATLPTAAKAFALLRRMPDETLLIVWRWARGLGGVWSRHGSADLYEVNAERVRRLGPRETPTRERRSDAEKEARRGEPAWEQSCVQCERTFTDSRYRSWCSFACEEAWFLKTGDQRLRRILALERLLLFHPDRYVYQPYGPDLPRSEDAGD